MSNRSILQVFDQYQKARLSFVQSVAELATKAHNVDQLQKAGVLDLLKPLISDVCGPIQQCAAVAVGRLVHADPRVGEKLLSTNFLPVLLNNFEAQPKNQKKALLFVLRSLCRNDPQMATFVTSSGGFQAFIMCLEDFDCSVKESAAWAIGNVARHNAILAQACVDAGAVPLLILCLQEPDLPLKQIAASAMSDIAKHSLELGQNVVDAGAIPYLVKNLSNLDEKLKRQILCALSSCAKHSAEMAEVVVEAEVFPTALLLLAHPCPMVRRNAACLVRDIVKHSLELTQMIVNTGGIGALMEVLNDALDDIKVPAITALGYVAGHSEQFAIAILGCQAVVILGKLLNDSTDDAVLSVTAWTLGQIGKHSPEHSQAIGAANIFPRLLALLVDASTSEDLKYKCKVALKLCLQKCLRTSCLEDLLETAPPNILKYVLGQFSKVLPHDPKARRLFVTSGCLKRVQEIDCKPGSTLMEYISVINSCFPDEIVRYYSPGYPETLLEKVEQYSPQMITVLRETNVNDTDVQTELSALMGNESESEAQDIQNATAEE